MEQHDLEASEAFARLGHVLVLLPAPFPKRWAAVTLAALAVQRLERSVKTHRSSVAEPGGYYENVLQETPRLAARLEDLKQRFGKIDKVCLLLRTHVEASTWGVEAEMERIRVEIHRAVKNLRALIRAERDILGEHLQDTPALD